MKKTIWSIITIAYVLCIWGLSSQDAAESGQESLFIVAWLRQLAEMLGYQANHLITDHIVRKVAHFTEYFILAGLAVHLSYLYACRWKNVLGYILFGLLLVPVIDEFIQLFSAGRAGMVQDVLLDFFGAVTGLVVVKILHILTRES